MSVSDARAISKDTNKARTLSVSDAAAVSTVFGKKKADTTISNGVSRQNSSKKGSRKSSTSTNEEAKPGMAIMSQRKQDRIQINYNLASKHIKEDDDDVFKKKEKNIKSDNIER